MRIKKLNKYVWFIGLLALSVTMVVIGIRCSSKSSTNSGTNNSGGVPSATSLTISGVLISGTVALNTQMAPLSNASLNTLDVPLTGDVLYCMTLSNTPAAAKSQPSDSSGNVSLTLAAQNVPLGCFIEDASGNIIAVLVFSSTTSNAQTAQLSGSTDLGTITVDLGKGLAVANLTASGTLITTTPSGVDCPVGEWQGNIGGSPCAAGNMTATVWIAKLPSGQYNVSLIAGPMCLPKSGCSSCGTGFYEAFPSATYQGGSFTFQIEPDPSCPQKVSTITFTTDSSCQTATMNASATGCGSCEGGCDISYPNCGKQGQPGCRGCGSTTCSEGPYTFTRK